jgi:hypothetical protein
MNNSQCATDKPLSNKEEVEHNLAVKWSWPGPWENLWDVPQILLILQCVEWLSL